MSSPRAEDQANGVEGRLTLRMARNSQVARNCTPTCELRAIVRAGVGAGRPRAVRDLGSVGTPSVRT